MILYSIGILTPMFFSLFIYLIYRPSDTVVNQLFQSIFQSDFEAFRLLIQHHIHFPSLFIYNIPEGLWVFSLTLAARDLKITLFNTKLQLIFFPLFFSVGLEILQALNITDGTFDFIDISTSVIFWTFAFLLGKFIKQDRFLEQSQNFRFSFFSFLFACICLSDVLPV